MSCYIQVKISGHSEAKPVTVYSNDNRFLLHSSVRCEQIGICRPSVFAWATVNERVVPLSLNVNQLQMKLRQKSFPICSTELRTQGQGVSVCAVFCTSRSLRVYWKVWAGWWSTGGLYEAGSAPVLKMGWWVKHVDSNIFLLPIKNVQRFSSIGQQHRQLNPFLLLAYMKTPTTPN